MSNHGPMAADALFALGRGESVISWVENYKSCLQDRPETLSPIARDTWREALGDVSRVADWVAFFDRELTEAPWEDVVREWIPKLAPALMSAATHGLIRTSHAVRSLALSQTTHRIHELAQGLGYWAARYQVLPGKPSERDAGKMPSDALEHVRRVHGPDFQARGLISEQVKGLDEEPGFAGAIDLVGTVGDLSQFISDLTETFAKIYLANHKGLVAFVHTVTAPSALRMLKPYLLESDARLAARYAWQACAAIYAWYSATAPSLSLDLTPPAEDFDDIIDQAVAVGGPHTIKFTEACLREYALNPKPVYLVAARDAAERVGPV
ncbi:MAG: questin oxidase family protein [Chloroflexi bacterium]|nr:questin oxidase family protein [Chloroflexota bacterium]